MSCLVASRRVVSRRVSSCRVASSHVRSGRVSSRRVASCRVLSCRVASRHVGSNRVESRKKPPLSRETLRDQKRKNGGVYRCLETRKVSIWIVIRQAEKKIKSKSRCVLNFVACSVNYRGRHRFILTMAAEAALPQPTLALASRVPCVRYEKPHVAALRAGRETVPVAVDYLADRCSRSCHRNHVT